MASAVVGDMLVAGSLSSVDAYNGPFVEQDEWLRTYTASIDVVAVDIVVLLELCRSELLCLLCAHLCKVLLKLKPPSVAIILTSK